MTKRNNNLDKLIQALNHEALFNPDPQIQAQFRDLLNLALNVEIDMGVLQQEITNRDLGWVNFGDFLSDHSLDDMHYRDEDHSDESDTATS